MSNVLSNYIYQLHLTAPFIILVLTGLLLIAYEMITLKDRDPLISILISAIGIIYALYYNLTLLKAQVNETIFSNSVYADQYGYAASTIILIGGFISIFLAERYVESRGLLRRDFYSFMIFSLSGMVLMVWSADFLTLLVGLEIASIGLYTLAGLLVDDERSSEAAFKYFIMGALGSAMFMFGSSLIYAGTGTILFKNVALFLTKHRITPIILGGSALVISGLFFKISVVPFHMWTPDVYTGAPTPVTAFMAVAVKTAAVVSLFRIIFVTIPVASPILFKIFTAFALLTMILGNLAALKQTNLKRLLAYSSIAHAGYILVGFAAVAVTVSLKGGVDKLGSASAILFYLLAYTFMNLGAFMMVTIFQGYKKETVMLEELTGVARKHPVLAASFSIFLLSLAGIPPTVGFMGKFAIFYSAMSSGLLMLVVAGVINSLISVYYYLKIIFEMYKKNDNEIEVVDVKMCQKFVVFITLFFTLYLGIFPGHVMSIFKTTVMKCFF